MTGAYCEPEPIRRPRPPILVGGGGEQVTLRLAAKYADATNWQVDLEGFVRKSGLVDRYCEEIGRDPAEVARTHAPDCFIAESEADLRRWLDSPGGGDLWGETDEETYR